MGGGPSRAVASLLSPGSDDPNLKFTCISQFSHYISHPNHSRLGVSRPLWSYWEFICNFEHWFVRSNFDSTTNHLSFPWPWKYGWVGGWDVVVLMPTRRLEWGELYPHYDSKRFYKIYTRFVRCTTEKNRAQSKIQLLNKFTNLLERAIALHSVACTSP